MKIITNIDVEYLVHNLANGIMEFDEPIPAFSTRTPGILERCLASPFQMLSGENLCKGLVPTASALFYLLIKSKPFQKGNRIIAMTALFVFFYINGKWLKVEQRELYNFAVWVETSPAQLKDETVKAVEKFLKKYIVDLRSV
jgi:prophage maintenance system killer protein